MALPEFPDIPSLRSWIARERGAGKRIGLVPTMGALHEGHLSLVDYARRHAQSVVMSIFVNPLQFGPKEDFGRYPRDLHRDRAQAEGRGVHALFVPTVEAMYPPGAETRVVPGSSAERWEGEMRPGHFAGVLTVVAKLFHIVQPDVAVFGQKDIQQAVLIRQMAARADYRPDGSRGGRLGAQQPQRLPGSGSTPRGAGAESGPPGRGTCLARRRR